MPLSEHEQHLLTQMEQALATEDPRFADQMRGGAVRGVRRARLGVGLAGVVVGLALVLTGINTNMWVGVAGFAVMVAAVTFALASSSKVEPPSPKRGARIKTKGGPSAGGFMDKLDQRWEKRERGL